jgi:hypothetical protein
VVAVDLGGRGDQHPLPELRAVLEHVLGALDVREQRVAGLLDDQLDADDSREVVDDIALVHELADDGRGEHGLDDEVEVLPLGELGDVLFRSGRDVVENPHLAAGGEQALGQMRADEARTACDEHLLRQDRGRVPPSAGEPGG